MWEEIKELIDLAERVYNETPSHFSITIDTIEGTCNIFLSDDGQYIFYIENGIQKDFNSKQFNKAKAHMLKLLGEEVNANG